MSNLEFKIRDKRKSRQFYIDNEFVDGYSKQVGWQASLVYLALVRHSRNNVCFPSHTHLSSELNTSISSIKRGLSQLEKYNIIRIIMRTNTEKGRASNIYELQDYSVWKKDLKTLKEWSNKKK